MAGQVSFAIDDGRAAYVAKHDRLRTYDADFTPTPLAGVITRETLARYGARPPRRVLDLYAGPGVFSRWVRVIGDLLWGEQRPQVTAVEVREEEGEWLERNADAHLIGRWEELLDAGDLEGGFDLVLGNPAFSEIHDALPRVLELLAPGGLVAWLAPNGLGQRGAPGWHLFDTLPPIEQQRIRGPIHFRDGINPKTGERYGADVRDYSVWLWRKDTHARGWLTTELPRLDSSLMRWSKIKPGTEPSLVWPIKTVEAT